MAGNIKLNKETCKLTSIPTIFELRTAMTNQLLAQFSLDLS